MTSKLLLLLLPFLLLAACGRPSPSPSPKLPAPDGARPSMDEAAVVWVRPEDELEYAALENQGRWDEILPVRSLWVVPSGRGWAVVSERPGLFVLAGARLREVFLSRYALRQRELPAQSASDPENLADCREELEGNPDFAGFLAVGAGLTLRELDTGDLTPLVPAPESLAALEYPIDASSYARPLGSLGPYLFVQVSGYAQPCARPEQGRSEFKIFDLAKGADLTEPRFSDSHEQSWKRQFDTEPRRRAVEPELKSQLTEYGADGPFDATNLYVYALYPVFPVGAARVAFEVVYRYYAGCRACDPFEAAARAATLPAELDAHGSLHPAVEAARPRVPKGWRVAGVTHLIAPAAEVRRLRARFDTLPR